MTTNDNTVNIKGDQRGYHHGDLRAAAVAEGLRLLESQPAEALSLRQIARNVGVTATALYRHFPDKEALLQALAREGLTRLAALQTPAPGTPLAEGFAASGRAYVRFALVNPGLFRLIFSTLPSHAHPEQASTQGSAAWLLREMVTQILGDSASNEDRFVAVLRAWSLVHGLAMLILDGQVDRAVAERLIDRVVGDDAIKVG